ncbi:hypothetical protein AOXY_G32687 [Acipenser oxyrinchus oxyrinchus]|uniref:Uncharacterized protein n=1 Tax=Acipenser oxyrinchus oxyrinchus TaxID=40147 RepID=A0AAD8CJV7_ACIOX|nr:hypothetical protein AOXY_G32687 [Acipenser oxyrinchus oxyrinchus]
MKPLCMLLLIAAAMLIASEARSSMDETLSKREAVKMLSEFKRELDDQAEVDPAQKEELVRELEQFIEDIGNQEHFSKRFFGALLSKLGKNIFY